MSAQGQYLAVTISALKYFLKKFEESKKARTYVFGRIPEEVATEFKVGYAPGNGLLDWFRTNNVPLDIAIQAGLIGQNEDDSCYEVFTNRVMLPIINAKLVAGFAGRTLIDHPTKYLNSRSSKFYNKKENLYGLWKAAKYMEEERYGFLVEGYFDVLGLWSSGVRNVAASCGTAFGDYHALLFRRYVDRVFICYDGDEAGKKATAKARKVLVKYDIFGGTVELPEGDPDEYIQKYGKDKFLALAKV